MFIFSLQWAEHQGSDAPDKEFILDGTNLTLHVSVTSVPMCRNLLRNFLYTLVYLV